MKNVLKVNCVFVTLVFISSIVKGQTASNGFIWGINGHPLTQPAYSNNLDEQIKDIKDLNASSYRFDVILNSDGSAKNEPAFLNLLKTLKTNNILPLPAAMQSGSQGGGSTDDIYNASVAQGKTFATKYGDQITVMEVNNEGDNKIRLRGNGSSESGDYDRVAAPRFIAKIKGFIDGVKAVKSSIKITLSVSFTHYYYLQLLKDNNVNYDIIGLHWYSNMGDVTNLKNTSENVLVTLGNKFNKPIWITEFNQFKGTTTVDYAHQNDFITKNIKKITAQGIVKAIYIYELFDQPYLKQRYPTEYGYGIMYKDAGGNFVKKDAFQGYKTFTTKN